MSEDRGVAQDELIRQNAENIRRNQDTIRLQTEYLEKICSHYFPQKTLWKHLSSWFLKAVGALTIAAGLLEAADWCWNTRQQEQIAKESAAVANRLMFLENDMEGAMRFLEKAVEYDTSRVRYRMLLTNAKGLAAVVEFFDIGRPFTDEESRRIDDILAESVFLQEADPDLPMPYVLGAHAYQLRGDAVRANAALERALSLAPDEVLVRVNAGLIRFSQGDVAGARAEIAAAARLDAGHPIVLHWQGLLALLADRDPKAARAFFLEMQRRKPLMAIPHLMLGQTWLADTPADLRAARAEFKAALLARPDMKRAKLFMGETYEREGEFVLARLWYGRALKQDSLYMNALIARARVAGKAGDWRSAQADLSEAIALAPFRADLYRERAAARTALGETDSAADDLKTAAALAKAE